ncbi:NAD(P)H-dependent oxidoreductase [Conexibacter sp. JD483]|uniref:NADPH-dependent FMN reductase n=1 Tax=unclassified Conexibacter TaxID=2627773 RepID=UPI0027265E60|nr:MULTISPECIES: NAD(P)H-dependent oxidoreductase [unclassified Conexibacter]MDO8187945.1 NAD(P)H-dependent oxidoreductase [Conexibacter sp. CPCC 205706]MDO8200186.1 NAD(P)H-dependent oxidoreductase [Conexibacter sp. CPCC 205762]MDR9369732.1 NAD(P)H-dependent oxidoreductase [Conexibacter sp. JD483]
MIAASPVGAVGSARADARPLVVGIGGTTRADSSSERAVRAVLREAELAGARTEMFAAERIEFPMYAPERGERPAAALEFVEAVRRADGLVIASPGYHGGLSGLVKNALDYIEDLREDERPYLHGRAVGCVACAYGWQATTTTLVALRSVVHALRGWPTPLGVALNSTARVFDEQGAIADAGFATQARLLAGQVVDFAHVQRAAGRVA